MNRLYILLTVMVVMLGALLGAADELSAQGLPGTPAPTGQSAICQNPQRVLEPVIATGDTTTSDSTTTTTFTTTTNDFRVNYASINAAPDSTATIRIQDEAFQNVAGTSRTIDADTDTSAFFNLPPGIYRVAVDIEPESAESVTTYTVSVDECSGTTPGPTDESAICQNPQRELTVADRTVDSTNSFTTTGNAFRVNYTVDFNDDVNPLNNATIRVVDSVGQDVVEPVNVEEDVTNNSFIVNVPAGTYDLVVDIEPENGATYTVTVDECSETTTGTTDASNTSDAIGEGTAAAEGGTAAGGTADAAGDATGGNASNTVIVENSGSRGIDSATPNTSTADTTVNAGATAAPGTPTGTTTAGATAVASAEASPGAAITAGASTLPAKGLLSKTIPSNSKVLPDTSGPSVVGPAVALLTLLIIGATKVLLSVVRR